MEALLGSPERLRSEGLAALRAMRRAAAEPTFSLEERAEYQDLVNRLERAQAADWSERRRAGQASTRDEAGPSPPDPPPAEDRERTGERPVTLAAA
ncbi:hypothetical protein VQH23_02730 [Pararoseomonas sp. SCSIO 73927]|uniref:hypothetical protein n=1 Tax=Pararoseomonas sp. SCSIO 73927 TaxID=3114537 RepID=UPI0030D58C61